VVTVRVEQAVQGREHHAVGFVPDRTARHDDALGPLGLWGFWRRTA